MKKVLIIRFSSFGDIVQATGILPTIKSLNTDCEVHWLTRNEFSHLLEVNPLIDKVIGFDKSKGLLGLLKLGQSLAKENYEFIYDSHNNLRSMFLKLIFIFFGQNIIVRSKFRLKRLMLFSFRKNFFNEPFMGISSYMHPLKKVLSFNTFTHFQEWNFSQSTKENVEKLLKFEEFIALAPSAAWEMKRWPKEYWTELIKSMPSHNFVILGGPQDKFCQEFEEIYPGRIQNIAGKTSLIDSCYVVKKSQALVSGDTGLLHVADVLGVNGVALIGPTACYPTSSKLKTLEVNLYCKPCSKDGRGKCVQSVFQKCMTDITVNSVKSELLTIS